MRNILFIHGYNGSPDGQTASFVKEYFSNDNVIAPKLDLLDFSSSFSIIKDIISSNIINIVVAHSFGAFYAFALQDEMLKIVINPCMFPSHEIPKLCDNQLSEDWISEFERLEEKIYSHVDGEICQTTFAIFGNNDELFSYKDVYKKLYGTNSLRDMNNYITLPGKHRLSKSSMERGLSKAMFYAEVFNPKFFFERKLQEHYLNIFTDKDDEKANEYKKEVFDILHKAYESIGGIYGLRDVDALIDDSDFWKIDKTNNHINAVAVYTFKRSGRKLQYAACDGTEYGKSRLYKIIDEDKRCIDRNSWAEVSGKLEHIYLKHGAIPLPIDAVKALMPDKTIYELSDEDIRNYKGKNDVGDGFHYIRAIGTIPTIKLCVSFKKD